MSARRVAGWLPASLVAFAWICPAAAQQPGLLATPAVEIATVTGELLGQASACRVAPKRLNELESRIKTALGRAAANAKDHDYAVTRYQEEKASGADRQRRRRTGLNCDVVVQTLIELERRRF